MTYKPKDNHPWKTAASSEAIAWAREQAHIRKVNNLSVARNETLSRRTKPTEGGMK